MPIPIDIKSATTILSEVPTESFTIDLFSNYNIIGKNATTEAATTNAIFRC